MTAGEHVPRRCCLEERRQRTAVAPSGADPRTAQGCDEMTRDANRFYITTAIDYPNSRPHIGTAFEKIGADVQARFRRMEGALSIS